MIILFVQAFDDIKVILKGPITVPPEKKIYAEIRGEKFTSGNQVLRKIFQLYANVRPAKSIPGTNSKFPETDLVVIRENTEGLYTGLKKLQTVLVRLQCLFVIL